MSVGVRPKILYATSDASPQSGAFRTLMAMSSRVADHGFDPFVAVPEGAASTGLLDQLDGSRIRFIPLFRPQRGRPFAEYGRDIFQLPGATARLVRMLREDRFDLVHVNEIVDAQVAVAARIAGVPCVWHIRADLSFAPSPVRTLLPRLVVALADEIVVVSRSVYEETFAPIGVRPDRVTVVPNAGPDPAVFRPDGREEEVRRELGAGDGPLVVLVAKLGRRKGHDVLLKAAPAVLRAFPDAMFAIVGGELEGAHHARYAQQLRRLPARLGIEQHVVFTGYRTDVASIMGAADIVTHCSTFPDPFPGVVLQAMALGRAVIASNIGGPCEQIEPGVSGHLVPPDDPSALADAITSLLGNPETRGSLGAAARSRVRSVFGSEVFYERLFAVYDRVLSRRREPMEAEA